MTFQQQIQQVLITTFDDQRLSSDEKFALDALLAPYANDIEMINYTRNKAFELYRDRCRISQREALKSLKWLEKIIKLLENLKEYPNYSNEAAFSPGKSCLTKINQLIKKADFQIKVCVFTLSDDRIANELLKAHERGISIRILSDNLKSKDKGSDIVRLSHEGLRVRLDKSINHMHHKFAIFDNRILVNGSFNWTRSATEYNAENIVISNDMKLIQAFDQEFEKLWKNSVVAR